MKSILFAWLFILCYLNYTQALDMQPGDLLVGRPNGNLLQIKQSSGNQSLFPPALLSPDGNALAIDSSDHLLILHGADGVFSNSITQLDLNTGSQKTIFSTISTEVALLGIAVEASGMIIAHSSQSVSKIDPSNGEQTVIASGPQFSNLTSLLIDQNNDIILTDSGNNTVFRINPDLREVNIVSTGGLINSPFIISTNPDGDYILSGGMFVKINSLTGEQSETLSAPLTTPDGTTLRLRVNDLFVDSNGDFIVSGTGTSATGGIGIFRVDPTTGVSTNIAPDLANVSDIVSNTDDGDLFVFATRTLDNTNTNGIFRINLVTGEVSTVVINSLITTGKIAINSNRKIFAITKPETSGSELATISEINPKTAETTTITSGGLLLQINGIVADKTGALFVSDIGSDSIIRINPKTGGQSIVTSDNNIHDVTDIVVDMENNIYLLTLSGTVVRVDPVTGVQTVVGNVAEGTSLAIETTGNILVAVNDGIVRMSSVTGNITDVTNGELLNQVSDIVINLDDSIIVIDTDTVVSIDQNSGAQLPLSEDGYLGLAEDRSRSRSSESNISTIAIVPDIDDDQLPTPTPTPVATITPSPSPTSSPTPDPAGKSFTFNCNHKFLKGPGDLERLVLELGVNESCVLRLANHEPGRFVEVSTNLRTGFRSSVRVSPIANITDNNGEIEFTISTIGRGIDWIAWAVPNEEGTYDFSNIAYKTGLAWGLFVEVR